MLSNDGKDTEAMGGALVEMDNVYISSYGSHVSGPRVKDLEVGESCVKRYNLSGGKPTEYKIVRTE
jgi:hypothetical protein